MYHRQTDKRSTPNATSPLLIVRRRRHLLRLWSNSNLLTQMVQWVCPEMLKYLFRHVGCTCVAQTQGDLSEHISMQI